MSLVNEMNAFSERCYSNNRIFRATGQNDYGQMTMSMKQKFRNAQPIGQK